MSTKDGPGSENSSSASSMVNGEHGKEIEGAQGVSPLSAWYSALQPVTCDIVGEVAGHGLLAIHGESLLAHCLKEARVDFTSGFQLLHAVHAVENFLQSLKDRGCNFHVLWFDEDKHLCIPDHGVADLRAHGYLLARSVVIQHLHRYAKATASKFNFRFPSIESNAFENYVSGNAVRLFLCQGAREVANATSYQLLVYRFCKRGYSTGYIDDLEFVSSKVNAPIIFPLGNQVEIPLSGTKPPSRPQSEPMSKTMGEFSKHWDTLTRRDNGEELSAREVVSLVALGDLLLDNDDASAKDNAAAFLVHLALLQGLSLSDRAFKPHQNPSDQTVAFMTQFAETALSVIDKWFEDELTAKLSWDIHDLVDGRLYFQVVARRDSLRLSKKSAEVALELAGRLGRITNIDFTTYVGHYIAGKEDLSDLSQSVVNGQPRDPGRLLPFNHPVLDPYLESVEVETSDEPRPDASKIFQELTHWHNEKKPVVTKRVIEKKGFHALRRTQKFMADTIEYSASLTNAAGKQIDPEIITVHTGKPASKQASKPGREKAESQPDKKEAPGKKQPGTAGKNKKAAPKSGREKAHEAAAARQNEKLQGKSVAVTAFWVKRCQEFEAEKDLVRRYLKGTRYLTSLPNEDAAVVGAEATLYLCNTLVLLLSRSQSGALSVSNLDITALLWATVCAIHDQPLSRELAKQLESFRLAFKLPGTVTVNKSEVSRKLPFRSVLGTPGAPVFAPANPVDFQLERCGPYLERSYGSVPDARVPFQPDHWQRKVLDAIDDSKSLLVVAPTSAGKTFISFYAMKTILRANDDDVLVYVAPTKALVNQIAAEIQARFSKTYHRDGRSVWAVHTGDYRVNNPTGCQILVTVPHVLQIMLLAPANAQKASSWSHRVKRIIFDEVHCIGQAEDGIIWEQLLLLAPCPIIALSATIGNPLEFKSWLEETQRSKGYELEMIVHSARYSDLRKFFYKPQAQVTQGFNGLDPVQRLPIPGLDQDEHGRSCFQVVHPIGAIMDRSRGTLDDIHMEARDCLTLWQCMAKHQTEDFPLDASLHPRKFLPAVIKKSDLLEWEKALKAAVLEWIKAPNSPFPSVRAELGKEVQALNLEESTESELAASSLSLVTDLRRCGALPALLFNYDRLQCEIIVRAMLGQLEAAEAEWKQSSPEWKKTTKGYEAWQEQQARAAAKGVKKPAKSSKRRDADDDESSKLDMARDAASGEGSVWDSFDPDEPVEQFSFADKMKVARAKLESMMDKLKWAGVPEDLVRGLRRGLGVHHAGMNRKYRQVVEILFRRGFLTVVVATGTLALGINMPCRTVVFTGDSIFLNALNYRQASGRSGRRGFDLLGNVVFHGLDPHRGFEVMSSTLPDLRGHFPVSTTLILRLMSLLNGTNNSKYAARAVESLLSQTRLYLGGPSNEIAIKHHVRFSIEYLRRQRLLSDKGSPLNFASLVGNLYFTENAVFAFHSLLKEGYFHSLCAGIDRRPEGVLKELMLVLCHLFSRIPCHRYKDEEWLDRVVSRSPSLVILPPLPETALGILEAHNQEVLDIFKTYVSTYIHQHLSEEPDRELPLTKLEVGAEETPDGLPLALGTPQPTTIRSPFAALSGHTDAFGSVRELCSTTRAGVFLEESAVPRIPIYPAETGGVPWNAYAYDFFRHGDAGCIARDNGIAAGDVWFKLRDFSVVLATAVASLEGLLGDGSGGGGGADMADVVGVAETMELERWDDEPGDKIGADGDRGETDSDDEEGTPSLSGWDGDREANLVNVCKAFKMLQEEFDEKFRKTWS